MNKKGFTLIELLATIVIIALIMSFIMPSATKLINENNEKIYHEYEQMMIEYAQVSKLNHQDRIDLNDLEGLEKVKEECTGYVTINHSSEKPIYQAFITCGDKYSTT